jgi:beta-N-acetylhexosaminidase
MRHDLLHRALGATPRHRHRTGRAGSSARIALACGLALLALAACGGTGSGATAPGGTEQAGAGTDEGGAGTAEGRAAGTTAPPTTAPAPAACRPTGVEAQAASLLLVGMPGVVGADDPLVDELVALGVGGVLLNGTNVASTEQLRALTAGLAERFGGHVTIALDQEGGRVSPLARIGLGGPSARRLGALDGDAIEAAGALAGQEAASVGATMVLGPVADLDDGPAGEVIGDRAFGSEPGAVGEAARRYARGVRAAGVATAAKHWPGYAMAPDTHLGAGSADVEATELVERHVAAFVPLLEDGVESVMVSHVTYPSLGELPASVNPAAYELLRSTGYEGPAMTDALGMGSIHTRWPFDRSPAMAVAAGADIALANQGAEAAVMRDGIVAAVSSGEIPTARLEEAVRRASAVRPGC